MGDSLASLANLAACDPQLQRVMNFLSPEDCVLVCEQPRGTFVPHTTITLSIDKEFPSHVHEAIANISLGTYLSGVAQVLGVSLTHDTHSLNTLMDLLFGRTYSPGPITCKLVLQDD